VEIASPANKDRAAHVSTFADKFEMALWRDVHALLLDVLSPGRHDPQGMHSAVWDRFADEPYTLPSTKSLTLASYVGGQRPEAYVEHLNIGDILKPMPLFLSADRYVNAPLEATYLASFRGLPALYRSMLERE
jgi:hypothetical protein